MRKDKKRKKETINYEKYDNLELELKMMETELHYMLISSSYPQVSLGKNKKSTANKKLKKIINK
jgi:hypothetical protein